MPAPNKKNSDKTTLAYRELKREVANLAKEVLRGAEHHKSLASRLAEGAKNVGRTADNIASLNVDTATVAETRELSKTMQGLSQSANGYATSANDASQVARYTERAAIRSHEGIQQAVDNAPVPMANRTWYTQE
ncbi:hypothetical protein ABZW10_35960 [Kitasatospora sp. NPDC004723]|uniref:hypothetical protein n=1 Tax=Kitasatospora sp. NPDC004723 TaxID=3154288 RepID=UPI0033AEE991